MAACTQGRQIVNALRSADVVSALVPVSFTVLDLMGETVQVDVNLRTVGQRDPLLEFKHEAFSLFKEFSQSVRTEIAQDLFRFEIFLAPPSQPLPSLRLEKNRSLLPEGELLPEIPK